MDEFKVTDDYQNERLKLLMEAVGNDGLDGESCPRCFEKYAVPILRKLRVRLFKPNLIKGEGHGVVDEALAIISEIKDRSVLRKLEDGDEIVQEYVCAFCNRKCIGELDLIANQAERRVLSFFGYDDTKIYQRDFYTFSVLDDSYDTFVKELWDSSVKTTFDAQSMVSDAEDVVTGAVLGQLRAFFEKFAKIVYEDLGASVEVFASSHANKLEKKTGADFAIWVGPLTTEDIQVLTDFKNGKIGFEDLPVRVGNGAVFQAKKGNTGTIDKKQLDDLVQYASISYKGHDYFGIPGKLFMNYSPEPPFVTVLSCDYTYALYSGSLLKDRNTVSFPKTLKDLSDYAKGTELPEFIQAYLSGKAGTPLLMLRDVFGVDGPQLIVGLPPEMLRNPSTSGHSLSGILHSWCTVLEESVHSVQAEEVTSETEIEAAFQARHEVTEEEEAAVWAREQYLLRLHQEERARQAEEYSRAEEQASQERLRKERERRRQEQANAERAVQNKVRHMH